MSSIIVVDFTPVGRVGSVPGYAGFDSGTRFFERAWNIDKNRLDAINFSGLCWLYRLNTLQ